MKKMNKRKCARLEATQSAKNIEKKPRKREERCRERKRISGEPPSFVSLSARVITAAACIGNGV